MQSFCKSMLYNQDRSALQSMLVHPIYGDPHTLHSHHAWEQVRLQMWGMTAGPSAVTQAALRNPGPGALTRAEGYEPTPGQHQAS